MGSRANVVTMWSLLRTRRWQGFTLLVVIAITAFGLLSSWQWSRAEEERQARNAQIRQTEVTRVDLITALEQLPPVVPGDLRRPIEVTGTYLPQFTVLVRQRPLDGRNGFWVVTPLRLEQTLTSGSDSVWVNRGWMPATGAATAIVDPPPPPTGTVQVFGWLMPSETTREVINDLPVGQVRWLDTEDLPDLATPRLPVFVERVASDPGDPDLLALPLPEIDDTQNISYAIQWLVFASIALAGWVFFLRREAKEDAELRGIDRGPMPSDDEPSPVSRT